MMPHNMKTTIDRLRSGRVSSRLTVVVLLVAFALSTAAFAQESGADAIERDFAGPDFKAFSIIFQRNVFDPSRRAYRDPKTVAKPKPAARLERIMLTGVLVHERGAFAFFDGERSSNSRGFKLGATVAGCKLKRINTDGVVVDRDGEEIEIPVGSGLSRYPGEPWKLDTSSKMRLYDYDNDTESYASYEGERQEQNKIDKYKQEKLARYAEKLGVSSKTPAASGKGDYASILQKLKERRKQEMSR